MQTEAPTPGWAPESTDQADNREWSIDSDMTDPHGWPRTPETGSPRGYADARDLTDAHGWTDTLGQPGGGGAR